MLIDDKKFNEALKFAEEVHKNQKRDDGSPYFNHILGVVNILKEEFGINSYKVLTAAALHDIIEDSSYTKEDISAMFGEIVANMVAALSKTKGMDIRDYFLQIDNVKEIENNSTWRIKFADRIHNVRDLGRILNIRPDKVIRYIKETEDYFLGREFDIESEYKELLIEELQRIKKISLEKD